MRRIHPIRAPRPFRWTGAPCGLLVLFALGGCELPTELPIWNTTWVVPGDTSTVTLASILPAGLSVSEDGTQLRATSEAASASWALRDFCGACALADGLVLPKPEFTANVSSTVDFPGPVVSVSLAGGTVTVQLQHNFGFDPLRPSATARGFLVLTLSSDGTVVAKDSISGNDVAFPSGSQVVGELAIQPATAGGSLTFGVTLFSPAGDPVVVDADARLSATIPPAEIIVSEARVVITGETIQTDPVELDLEDVDETVTDHLKAGALRLRIDNPLDVTGSLDFTISAPDGTRIDRSIVLQPGVSDQRVALNQAELQSILGKPGVTLQGGGSIATPAEGTVVTADTAIEVVMNLELTVGGKEGD